VTSEVTGLEDFTRLVHPEDLAQVMESVNHAIADRTIFSCEFRILRADGSVRWLSDVGRVKYDDGGRPLQIVGTVQDVSERKRAEEEIKKREKLLEDSQRLAQVGSWEWDITINQTVWSDELYRISGLPPREVTANYDAFLHTVHPDDRERVNQTVQGSMSNHQPFSIEYRVVWPDGTVRTHFAHGEIILDPASGPIRMYGFAQDITERRRAEEALGVSRGLLNNIIDSTPSYIFATDLQHRYVLANNALARLFGTSKEELLGKTEHDVFPKTIADSLASDNDQIMAMGTPLQIEEVVESKTGGIPRVVSTVKFPLRDAEGKIYGLGGVATDITDHKRAEDALRDSIEHLHALSRRLVELQESERRQISRELHDEVGQILAGIKLTLETNLSSLDPPVRTSLVEAVELVDDVIDRVRDLSLNLRPSMLDDLGLLPTLKWHMERYTKQTQVVLLFRHDGMDRRFGSEIETAAYRIIQEALTNVALHARVKEASVRCESKDNDLRIEIEDRGSGFNPTMMSRNSPGLSGMKERAEVLGGTFEIISAPEAGTRVTIRLPLAMPEVSEHEDVP